MSTRMDGINQISLFSNSVSIDVIVSKNNPYRILAENLPWVELAGVANIHRSKSVDIHLGRPLDLRMHLGAFIGQGMNGWTDRQTEEMVAQHAGMRVLCGLEQSSATTDHASIVTFRNQLGPKGAEAINKVVVQSAQKHGLTDGKLCSSDTTVQEAPIAYPTEVGHLKNIGGKLIGIGAKIKTGCTSKLKEIGKEVSRVFTGIRLFTRGKKAKQVELKKKLSKKLQETVSKMKSLVQEELKKLEPKAQAKYQASLDFYEKLLSQIKKWLETGKHPAGKIISLWETTARAIQRNKAGKKTEFGRRWIITRLTSGYIIGTVCKKLGSDADVKLMPEVISHFKSTMGCLPKMVVYDRGGDGEENHNFLEEMKIKKNCIYRKGEESLPHVGKNTRLKANRERALSEASIATIKNVRYGFNKPRAKSTEGCILKGQFAILGANLRHLARDLAEATS